MLHIVKKNWSFNNSSKIIQEVFPKEWSQNIIAILPGHSGLLTVPCMLLGLCER